MKKWIIITLILLLGTGSALARPALPKKFRSPAKATAQSKAPAVKEVPYEAFLVMDARTGKILEEENSRLKRAPASVVKLMVATLVLEKVSKGEVKLTDPVMASKASSKIGGSQVFLKEGETFTLEEMMKAVMVASANDAAYAVAEHVAGSKEAFVQLMNQKAKALNMVDTEFHSVHGLPPSAGDQGDVSSCQDLALLARELLKYPKILEWTSIKTEGFRNGQFTMNNHNKLMVRMSEVDGLKTGYFRETGFNIVATALRNDLRLIVVILGSSKAKTRDTIALEKFKKAFAQFKRLDLIKKGDPIDKEISLPDGETGKIKGVAGTHFSCSIPVAKKGTVTREPQVPEKIPGAIAAGQKLGELVFKLDNEVIGKTDIVSPIAVPEAHFFKKVLRKVGIDL